MNVLPRPDPGTRGIPDLRGVVTSVRLVILAAVVAAPVAAQSIRVEVGRASSGVSWLYPPPSPSAGGVQVVSGSSNTDRRAFTIAASARWGLATWLSWETGLRLVPKGFEVTGPTFHMLYAEVPLVAVLQTGPAGGVFLEAGVIPGLHVRCRRFMQTVSGAHEDDCGPTTTAYGRDLEPLRRWDLSWGIGVGGRIPLGNGRIVLTARGQWSLIDVQPAVANEKMVNRVWMLMAGYEWGPGGGAP